MAKVRKVAAAAVVVVAQAEIPKFTNSDGEIRKLLRKSFPKTREGKMAFCDYMVEVWKARKVTTASKDSERGKIERRIQTMKKKMIALEAKLIEA